MIINTEKILRNRGLEKGGRVQKFIDSEVLRYCDPFVPFRTGMLKSSGTRGTVIGSGIVKYDTIYARKNYYENGGYGIQGLNNGGKRGRLWFKRMKELYADTIKKGAASLCRLQ